MTKNRKLKRKKVEARKRKLRVQRHTLFITAAQQRRAKRMEAAVLEREIHRLELLQEIDKLEEAL